LKITSDLSVRRAPPGEHTVSDAKGLILRIHACKDGDLTRSWIVRIRDGRKQRRIGTGSYPTVTLADARRKAQEAHRVAAEGKDPSQAAKRRLRSAEEARALTLRQAIDDYLGKAARAFKNPKSEDIRRRALLVHFKPLHAKDVSLVAPEDVADILRTLRPETASRAYTAARAVFDYAEAVLRPRGIVIHNPASTRQLAALGWKRKSRKTHTAHPSVPWELMPEVMAQLDALDGDDTHCLRLIIATALRCRTVFVAKWRNIDLEGRLWRIPVEDLKDEDYRRPGETFDVPLNDIALDVFRIMRSQSPSAARYVFTSPVGAPFANGVITNITRRLRRRHDHWRDPQTGEPFTAHGFRATFKTWSREAGLDPKLFGHVPPREIAELILGHQVGNDVEQTYDRSTLIKARRTMLHLWANQCLGAKILNFPQRA
jgi:integrase